MFTDSVVVQPLTGNGEQLLDVGLLRSELENEGASCGQGETAAGQIDGLAGGHITSHCCVAKGFLIAVEPHLALLGRAVDDGHGMAAVVTAVDDIDAVIGDELRHLALDDDIVALAPV